MNTGEIMPYVHHEHFVYFSEHQSYVTENLMLQ